MYVILCRYENKRWPDNPIHWEICYSRGGRDPYLGTTAEDAEDYLFYLQSSFGKYEEKPIYKIMKLEEIANAGA